MVIENTFTSILDMAGIVLPVLRHAISSQGVRPLNVVVRSQWRTIDIIDKVQYSECPLQCLGPCARCCCTFRALQFETIDIIDKVQCSDYLLQCLVARPC